MKKLLIATFCYGLKATIFSDDWLINKLKSKSQPKIAK